MAKLKINLKKFIYMVLVVINTVFRYSGIPIPKYTVCPEKTEHFE